MNYLQLIISPISGAVIGYFTNWLAVRMLFRPYREKIFLGKRLPFTPGLIPKEKGRIAQRLGETLSSNILTEEELNKAVSSPDVLNKVMSMLDTFLAGLVSGAYDGQAEDICGRLAAWLKGLLYKDGVAAGLLTAIYGKIREYAVTEGIKYLSGPEFKKSAEEFAKGLLTKLGDNDKRFGDYLPEDVTDSLREFIKGKAPEIPQFIKELPQKHPDLDTKLNEMIQRVAEENLGQFLGVILRYERWYDKIKNSLVNYLEDPVNRAFLTNKAGELADKLLDREVRDVAAIIPKDARNNLASRAAELIGGAFNEGAAEKFFEGIDKRMGDFDPIAALERFFPDIEKSIKSALLGIYRSAVRHINEENSEAIRVFAVNALKLIVEKGGAYVVNSLEFDKIVEEKINGFSMEETEELVVSVADKELKAITWLGGVLGFVIGFLPAITSFFS